MSQQKLSLLWQCSTNLGLRAKHKQPGAAKITFATLDPYKADSSLLESGLLGPVQIARRACGRVSDP
jgi:hypothetical protein